MRYIYQIPTKFLNEEMLNPFYFSELNENDSLPKQVLLLLLACKNMDEVYTFDNFMTCYNLQDSGTISCENYMFIPEEKFNKQIKDFFYSHS